MQVSLGTDMVYIDNKIVPPINPIGKILLVVLLTETALPWLVLMVSTLFLLDFPNWLPGIMWLLPVVIGVVALFIAYARGHK